MINDIEAARRRFASVRGWSRQFMEDKGLHHIDILEAFEESYLELAADDEQQISDLDPENSKPINILCLDGGGMKGKPSSVALSFAYAAASTVCIVLC